MCKSQKKNKLESKEYKNQRKEKKMTIGEENRIIKKCVTYIYRIIYITHYFNLNCFYVTVQIIELCYIQLNWGP